MSSQENPREEWAREVEALRARLDEAEETLRAIRSGEVDALVVAGTQGDQVFTLKSADHPYRVFIEEMNEGAVTLSDEGLILYGNRTFARIVKTPLAQVAGASFASFVKPADLPAFQTLLQESRVGRIVGEITGRAADDAAVPLRLSLTPLPIGSSGVVCIVATDMTEPKKKEEELRRAHGDLERRVAERTAALTKAMQELELARGAALNMMEDAVEAKKAVETANLELRQQIAQRRQAEEERARLVTEVRAQARQMAQILATVPTGVLLLDGAGQVLQANTVAEGDLAALAGVATGDTLTHLGDRPLAELLASPPAKGMWHEIKADGRTFEVIARPVENDPEPDLWVLVSIDVTREREIQAHLQQQNQLATVGQLAAGIAHDFNNIMAVIVLYTHMGLSMTDVPLKLRQRLEVVQQQANRATELIQQILDFSRRAVLKRRPMDLLLFVKETIKLLDRTMPENIRIELACGKDEYTVGADPTRMQQVIMNLATNARDAMLPQGDGKLCIVLSRTAARAKIRCVTCGQVVVGEQWVHIAVTDSGSGIPPEALSHIFEPFFSTKEVGKGTGLGLAQVYGIVKQHEGHIDVVTKVGHGTTFNIYLPALPVQLPEAPTLERQAPIQGQGETVLLVEDNVALRDALAEILEMLNYQTLQTANGREALAVLEQCADEIALVLSDLVMPEMGGEALLYAMRQRGLTLPMVILSGHPMESELEALQAQGLAGWMLKPPSVRPLAELLARVLHKESESG